MTSSSGEYGIRPPARSRASGAPLAVLIASVVALVIGLTWTYLSMRALMDVGGACASGGPYVPVQPCPSGAGFIGIAIPLGVVAALAATVAAVSLRAPTLLMPTWAALFGSLGWNFFDYGLRSGHGAVIGWIICGVVFWLMALPALLVMVIPQFVKRGSQPAADRQSSASWWFSYAVLAAIGLALGVWSFDAWR